MKVPNKVLGIVIKMAEGAQVSAEDRGTVLMWARGGVEKREAAKIEAARQLLASAEK